MEVTYGATPITGSSGGYLIENLAEGSGNLVTIKVTAHDGASIKNYRITINRLSEDAPIRWVSDFHQPQYLNVTVGATYSYTLIATNDYHNTLTFSFMSGHEKPDWLTLTPNADGTATLSGVPAFTNLGQAPVWLQVEDKSLSLTASGPQYFIITVQPPHKIFVPAVMR
jgi:hypothetical protein